MAYGEKRFHNFDRLLVSFDENQRLVGLIQPGRYRGFDAFTYSGLNATIGHSSTGGIQIINQDLTSGNLCGIAFSTQGTIIQNWGTLGPLAIADTTAGFPNGRYDLLVVTHQDVLTSGGQNAVFSIQQGPSNGTLPAVANPNSTVVLGVIYIPTGASDLSNATYTPTPALSLGGVNPALLNVINQFSAQQQENESATIQDVVTKTDASSVNYGALVLPTDGNLMQVDQNGQPNLKAISNTGIQPGTEIVLRVVNNPLTLHSIIASADTTPTLPSNMSPLFLGQDSSGASIHETEVSVGTLITLRLVKIALVNIWELTALSSNLSGNVNANATAIAAINAQLTNPGWTTATLENGAASSPGHPCQYKKDIAGNVHLVGFVLPGSSAVILTLPAGYRPTLALQMPTGPTTGSAIAAKIDISGNVSLVDGGGSAATGYTPFYLVFRAD